MFVPGAELRDQFDPFTNLAIARSFMMNNINDPPLALTCGPSDPPPSVKNTASDHWPLLFAIKTPDPQGPVDSELPWPNTGTIKTPLACCMRAVILGSDLNRPTTADALVSMP